MLIEHERLCSSSEAVARAATCTGKHLAPNRSRLFRRESSSIDWRFRGMRLSEINGLHTLKYGSSSGHGRAGITNSVRDTRNLEILEPQNRDCEKPGTLW